MSTRIPTFGLLAALFSTLFSPQGLAAEDDSAQTLYDGHCVSCHGAEVYTRDDRKVGSLPALESQVQRCEAALGLRWFDEDVSAVTELLNERFYHFKP